ncbi:hypothetical protein JB92DRAFT_3111375 [Gautieria morchelliformis]|nr:hypothetical protein JB92DRAFT_3111375 [Gautieria morchelliformis]
MASGFGYTGGRSRCFAHWQEFAKCYAQADSPVECKLAAEDYIECLHHAKEIARAKVVQAQFLKKAQQEGKDGRKAAEVMADGVIVGVGLISRKKAEEAEKDSGGKH